jgi:hypothetical protein
MEGRMAMGVDAHRSTSGTGATSGQAPPQFDAGKEWVRTPMVTS